MLSAAVLAVVLLTASACNFMKPRQQEAASDQTSPEGVGTIERLDPALHSLATDRTQIQRIITGYQQLDAPFYSREGYLLFNDVKKDTIRKWTPDGVIAEYRVPGGGAHCITTDPQRQLVVCETANHRISWTNRAGTMRPRADNVNNPQDAVFSADGTLYFTDLAPEGKKSGVYSADAEGNSKLLTTDLSRPSGIALSKDEKYLFVTNADPGRRVLMRFEVKKDGGIETGKVLFDFSSQTSPGVPGGVKLDVNDNLYVAGPGGIFVISADGKHLGTFKTPEQPTNLFWGKYADTTTAPAMGSAEYATTLYITGGGDVYRIGLTAVGVRP